MIAWWILVCNLRHIKSDAWLVTFVIDDMWQVAGRADIKIKKLSTRKNDNEMLQYKRSNNQYYLNLSKASSEVCNFLWKKTLSLEKKVCVHCAYGELWWPSLGLGEYIWFDPRSVYFGQWGNQEVIQKSFRIKYDWCKSEEEFTYLLKKNISLNLEGTSIIQPINEWGNSK